MTIDDYALLLAAHAVCVLLVLVAIWFRRARLRPVAVIAAAAAMWLPLFAFFDALGTASPFPPEGDYRVVATTMDDRMANLYLFARAVGGESVPRLYRIPYSRERYDRLSNSDYEQQVLRIVGGDNGEYDAVYVDYEPPDLLKGDAMRGYRAPRPED